MARPTEEQVAAFALLDERDRLAAEVMALREALERYGHHEDHCARVLHCEPG